MGYDIPSVTSGHLYLCFCRAELRSHENSGPQWCLFSGYLWGYVNLKPQTIYTHL